MLFRSLNEQEKRKSWDSEFGKVSEQLANEIFWQDYKIFSTGDIRRMKDDEQTSLHEEIFAALYKHNPRWYDAIRYVYYLEIPQSAVAERMEISIEVLHSLFYRARKWIRKKFGVEYEEFLELYEIGRAHV